MKMFIKVSLTLLPKKNILSLRKYGKLSYFHNKGAESLKSLTIGKLLEKTCEKHGNTEAIVSCHQNQRMTFQQVLNEANRMAAGFRSIGLQHGDCLGLWAPNLIEWYIANMACARAGLIMVAVNPAYQPQEMEYCINKVNIKGIVCGHKFKTQNFYEILNSIAPELSGSEPGKLKSSRVPSLKSVVTISEESLRGTYNFNEILDMANKDNIGKIKQNQSNIKMDDPCQIQMTSGTTGKPKASVISHFQLVNNGYNIGKRSELNAKPQRICVQVPLFHAFGTVITITAALNFGSTLVLPSASHDPDKTLDAIKKENCTIIHGTPTMYVDLVNKQMERNVDISPEIAIAGGAICTPQLFMQMKQKLKLKKVKSVYGLSETTAVVFHSLPSDSEKQSVSTVGFVGDHIEAKVVDSKGNLVPHGTPGELCIRGYCNMLGYWEDDEKTKEMVGADKWLKTGDQFVMDEFGYGTVVGRLKDMIIRGGENIFPKEIEEHINTHPDVIETQVVALPHERLGEEVCACIRIQNGKSVTLDEVKQFCKGQLSHFKIPSKLKIVEEFPKTASGKVQKFKLVELVMNDVKKC